MPRPLHGGGIKKILRDWFLCSNKEGIWLVGMNFTFLPYIFWIQFVEVLISGNAEQNHHYSSGISTLDLLAATDYTFVTQVQTN
jgi:hypothetical protein